MKIRAEIADQQIAGKQKPMRLVCVLGLVAFSMSDFKDCEVHPCRSDYSSKASIQLFVGFY